jgi:hypothetical protein
MSRYEWTGLGVSIGAGSGVVIGLVGWGGEAWRSVCPVSRPAS